jgi:hypothetical protein
MLTNIKNRRRSRQISKTVSCFSLIFAFSNHTFFNQTQIGVAVPLRKQIKFQILLLINLTVFLFIYWKRYVAGDGRLQLSFIGVVSSENSGGPKVLLIVI